MGISHSKIEEDQEMEGEDGSKRHRRAKRTEKKLKIKGFSPSIENYVVDEEVEDQRGKKSHRREKGSKKAVKIMGITPSRATFEVQEEMEDENGRKCRRRIKGSRNELKFGGKSQTWGANDNALPGNSSMKAIDWHF